MAEEVKTISMKLMVQPYEAIKSGIKTIEVRLNDEKRRRLMLGDHIIFSCPDLGDEIIEVEITELLRYKTFRELYLACGPDFFRNKSLEAFDESIHAIYSKEQEQKYGVLGIRFIKLEPEE